MRAFHTPTAVHDRIRFEFSTEDEPFLIIEWPYECDGNAYCDSEGLKEDLPRDEGMVAVNNNIDGMMAVLASMAGLGLIDTSSQEKINKLGEAIESTLDGIGNASV